MGVLLAIFANFRANRNILGGIVGVEVDTCVVWREVEKSRRLLTDAQGLADRVMHDVTPESRHPYPNMALRQTPQLLARIFSRTATSSPEVLTLPRLPIFEALNSHPKSKLAIVHSRTGQKFTYGELLAATARYKDRLLVLGKAEKEEDLKEKRVAILVENGYDYLGVYPNSSSSLSSKRRMDVNILTREAINSIDAEHLCIRRYCRAAVYKPSSARNTSRDV